MLCWTFHLFKGVVLEDHSSGVTIRGEEPVPFVTSHRADLQNRAFWHALSEKWSERRRQKDGIFSFLTGARHDNTRKPVKLIQHNMGPLIRQEVPNF